MKIITNLTRKPVSVPLPRGKKLHLGPGRTGNIAPDAAEYAAVKRLVELGTVEVADDGPRANAGPAGGPGKGAAGLLGAAARRGPRRTGDR